MELIVVADDRTGAIETAAALADGGTGPVPVVVWPASGLVDDGSDSVIVIDLGTRHLSPAIAADRAARVPSRGRTCHKIDSTLRGNWADELVGRSRASGRPVLLVPSLPGFGRTCVGGVVYEHDRPVHESGAGTDVRRRVVTSRPAEALRSAGAGSVVELARVEDVEAWLAARSGMAVVDAADVCRIGEIVTAWGAHPDVVLAGTSAVIGAAAALLGGRVRPPSMPHIDGPVLVVCGSVHPAAREQIDRAESRGVTVSSLVDELTIRSLRTARRLVLASEIPVGEIDEPVAIVVASTLARGVRTIADQVDLGALVVIGGDTAAAVLGTEPVVVNGFVAEGTAWSTVPGFAMPVITRSGGFGGEGALVELLWDVLR